MASIALQRWNLVDTLDRHASPVRLVSFAADGRMFTADTSLQARVRMPDGSEAAADLRSDQDRVRTTEIVRSASFLDDGVLIACGDRVLFADNRLQARWEYVPPRMLVFMIASPTAVLADQSGLLAAFNSGWVGRFDSRGNLLNRWRDYEAPRTMAPLLDGKVIGTDGFRVFARDPVTWMKLMDHRPIERVYGLAVPRTGTTLAVRTLEDVRFVDADTGQEHGRRSVPEGLPLVDWSPDARVVAVGGTQGVQMFDSAGGEIAEIRENQHLTTLAFHPDGRLATGWGDGTVRLYAP